MSKPARRIQDGQKFGRWRVICCAGTSQGNRWFWCICDCRKGEPNPDQFKKMVRQDLLLSGRSKSCGCLRVHLRRGKRYRKIQSVDAPAHVVDNKQVIETANYYEGATKCRHGVYLTKADKAAGQGKAWGCQFCNDSSYSTASADRKAWDEVLKAHNLSMHRGMSIGGKNIRYTAGTSIARKPSWSSDDTRETE